MSPNPYLLANAASQTRDRFAALSALFDRITFGHLEAIGVAPGWRVWEVGAGSASVPTWLARQVGPGGRVAATDIDTTWLEGAVPEGVDILVHDVVADPAPASDFDLIHARLVLGHVPERAEALRRLVGALRPGGWLVLEDFDGELIAAACPSGVGEDERRANRLRGGFMALLSSRGVDLGYGRKLPGLLRAAGLDDVAAEAFYPVAHPMARLLEKANTAQVAAGLIAAGVASQCEIDEHLAALTEGRIDISLPPLISTRGRRRTRGGGPNPNTPARVVLRG